MPSEKEWDLMKQSFTNGFRRAVALYKMEISGKAEGQWAIAKVSWKATPNEKDLVRQSFFAGFQHAIALEQIDISERHLQMETEREWRESLPVVQK